MLLFLKIGFIIKKMLGYYRRRLGVGGARRPPCKTRRKREKGGSEKGDLEGAPVSQALTWGWGWKHVEGWRIPTWEK